MAQRRRQQPRQKEITSIDIPNYAGGWFQGGAKNAPIDIFTDHKDVELDRYGFIVPRRNLVPFLPDTI